MVVQKNRRTFKARNSDSKSENEDPKGKAIKESSKGNSSEAQVSRYQALEGLENMEREEGDNISAENEDIQQAESQGKRINMLTRERNDRTASNEGRGKGRQERKTMENDKRSIKPDGEKSTATKIPGSKAKGAEKGGSSTRIQMNNNPGHILLSPPPKLKTLETKQKQGNETSSSISQPQPSLPGSTPNKRKEVVPLADCTNTNVIEKGQVKDKPPDNQFIMQIMKKEANRMAQMDMNQAMTALGSTLMRLDEL